jgi:enamine deaminase RidA (YjgF/YER057c/UK114 family)
MDAGAGTARGAFAMRRTIVPEGLRGVYEQWRYAPAVAANGFVHVCGIVGVSPGGAAPAGLGTESFQPFAGAASTTDSTGAPLAALEAVRDPEAQFAVAFETLRAILREAGADLSDVVEITSYHVGISTHMNTFMRVWARYLAEPYPAWTAVGVAELIVPGGLVELRAVAVEPR